MRLDTRPVGARQMGDNQVQVICEYSGQLVAGRSSVRA
jgi:hypothetical protein